ncbi:MAG: NfeD family protein [Desulfurobacteriaceae bacterium]
MSNGWVFLVLGLALIVIDVFVMTFFLFPVGVGFVLGYVFYSLSPSIFSFSVGFLLGLLSASFLSYKIAKKVKGVEDALSDLIGQEGIVVKKVDDMNYQIRFPLGAGGEELWIGFSEEELEYGDKVVVKKVIGNKVVVEKVK